MVSLIRRVNALNYEVYLSVSDEIPKLFEIVAQDKAGDTILAVYVNINENAIIKSHGDGFVSFDLGGKITSITYDDYRSIELW